MQDIETIQTDNATGGGLTRHKQMSGQAIRQRIEAMGTHLTLPTVKRALGVLEGEHQSIRRGSGYEFLDIRPYTPGDEARSIDWKASARSGRPMVVDKEQNVISRVWMLLDSGAQMLGTCESGESQMDVALNALRMFAALSLRRSDELSVIVGDKARITRMPLTGGYLAFDDLAERIAERKRTHPRDLTALLDYAKRIRDRYALIIIATANTAWTEDTIESVSILAQTHPMIVVDVDAVNSFTVSDNFSAIVDSTSGRMIPAFMRTPQLADDVDERREFTAKLLEQRLSHAGAALLHAGSSEDMFDQFVRHISTALTRAGSINVLAASHMAASAEEGQQ